MSTLTTRQDARERLRKMFEGALDRLIPPDESVPLKGSRWVHDSFGDGGIPVRVARTTRPVSTSNDRGTWRAELSVQRARTDKPG